MNLSQYFWSLRTGGYVHWAPKVLGQWHILLLLWLCTPALWIWHDTMAEVKVETVSFHWRVFSSISGEITALLVLYIVPHFRRPKLLEQIHLYSALRKYSAPLNFATFCHISGFKHKDIKQFFCEESTTSGTQSWSGTTFIGYFKLF